MALLLIICLETAILVTSLFTEKKNKRKLSKMRQILKLKKSQNTKKWKYKIISEMEVHSIPQRNSYIPKNEGLDNLEFYSNLISANPDRQTQVFSVKSSKF